MARVIQNKATKGSQRWLQELVNRSPELFNYSLRPLLGLTANDSITWLSPLESDDYAEYRDDDFLELLSIHLENRKLRTFWPSGGPQWDALGKTSRGDVLLVEAKAHISEFASNCQASPSSLELIQKSLTAAGRFFGAASLAAWPQGYYQYANRLAHLYLLRKLNDIPAWLIFLYITNAEDVAGPTSAEEWHSSIEAVHAHLGITQSQLGPHVVDVFFNVASDKMSEGQAS